MTFFTDMSSYEVSRLADEGLVLVMEVPHEANMSLLRSEDTWETADPINITLPLSGKTELEAQGRSLTSPFADLYHNPFEIAALVQSIAKNERTSNETWNSP